MTAWEPIRVLVIEDQQLVADVVKLTLNHGAYVARVANELEEAYSLLSTWQPHLVVINMDLGSDELLHELGSVGWHNQERVPTIALTRRGDLKAKLSAFEQGVDDILSIPFSPEELVARALAVTRRAYGPNLPFQPVLQVGDLYIDILNRNVRVGSSELHLTGLEQALLYLLASNAGRTVSREQILDVLWGPDYVAESNVVDRHIRSLRVKLQNDWRRPRFIATVPGKGYRFVPQAAVPEDAP
jgi:two-component system, OmpR family, KDP operon response regulator KdpE